VWILLIPLFLLAQPYEKGIKLKETMQNEHRVALVIGNNDYQGVLPKLNNPINDATAIKNILESRGFDVIYREDVSKKSLKQTLDEFYAKIAKGGVGMLYFSGHGLEVDGQNYLIPIDADIKAKSDTEFEAIALNKITKRMQNAGNRLNIVVLDACRNDPFVKAIGVGGLAKVEPIGLFVSYATGAGSVASDGRAGENGLFTKSLVKYMKQPLDLQEVFQKSREEVYSASNQKQFPAIYNQTINGKFFFTLPTKENSTTAPTQMTIQYQPKTPKVSVTKLIIDAKLENSVSVINSSSRVKNGMLQSIESIENHKNQKLTLQYRYKWFDDEGFEVGENMSIWQSLFLDPNDSIKVKGSAFVPTATSCKFYLK